MSSQFNLIFANFHKRSREINSFTNQRQGQNAEKLEWSHYLKNPYFYYLFQISTRTISDIDKRVKRIDGIARKYYSQSELEPLDTLVQKTEEIIRLMSDLSTSMRCEPIHM